MSTTGIAIIKQGENSYSPPWRVNSKEPGLVERKKENPGTHFITSLTGPVPCIPTPIHSSSVLVFDPFPFHNHIQRDARLTNIQRSSLSSATHLNAPGRRRGRSRAGASRDVGPPLLATRLVVTLFRVIVAGCPATVFLIRPPGPAHLKGKSQSRHSTRNVRSVRKRIVRRPTQDRTPPTNPRV